jgi:hypothetical protein
MKSIILLISFLVITISSSALTLKGFTKEEKLAIKALVKLNNDQELIEVSKGSNTAFKTVVEFTHRMYVLDYITVECVYVLGDGDWQLVNTLDVAYSYDKQRNTAYIFTFDEGKDEQRIDIEPTNGTPPFTLYYEDSIWDNRIQATIYYLDDIEVIIGDTYVIYSDSLDTWRWELPSCK